MATKSGKGKSGREGYYTPTQTALNYCNNSAPLPAQRGLLRKVTEASGKKTYFAYDGFGRVVDTWINDEWGTCVDYDARGRVTDVQYPPTPDTNTPRDTATIWAVNSNPLKQGQWDQSGTIYTKLDLIGRTKYYEDVFGNPSTITYDQAGRLTQSQGDTADPGFTGTRTITYDQAGRPATQGFNGKTVATASYNAASELESVTYPAAGVTTAGNGTKLTFGYDATHRLNEHKITNEAGTTTLAKDNVACGQTGKIIDQKIDDVDANTSGNNFTYDQAGRLVDAYVPSCKY